MQIKMNVNKRDIAFPHQLFIDNEFIDSSDGSTFQTINPTDESVSYYTVLSSNAGYYFAMNNKLKTII